MKGKNYAIVDGVKKFRCSLFGAFFKTFAKIGKTVQAAVSMLLVWSFL